MEREVIAKCQRYSVKVVVALLCLVSVAAPTAVHAWKWEAANFTTLNTFNTSNFQTVNLQQVYTTTPVVVVLATQHGGDSGGIRVRNVTTTSFENSPVEVSSQDGPHVAMNSAYIAVEPGLHALPNGDVVIAGFVDTTRVQHGAGVAGATSWETVNFGYDFGVAPVILAEIQTMNNEQGEGGTMPPARSSVPWLTVAVDNISSSQFTIALERSQEALGSVTQSERIGYIAIFQGANGTFTDNNGSTVQYLAETSNTNIRGWDQAPVTHTFSTVFSNPPVSIATKNSRNNPDGGWLKRNGNTTATTIRFEVDEDKYADNERSLSVAEQEAAGIISFSQNFNAEFLPGFNIEKTSSVISDPVNGTNSPKAIPGAVIEYAVTVTNTGFDFSDSTNFRITDPLPADTDLLLTDIAGAASGPVGFTEGIPSGSGTTWSFGGLADQADSVAFSTDGSDYSYVPTADGQGVDTAVTHLLLMPQGAFQANPTQPPSATYTYRVMIQ